MSDRRSFAEQSFRMYFADANRGVVLRLSRDGMTPISNYGMKDYFFDNLKDYTRVVGSFNDRKDIYNLTLDEAYSNDPKTISYTEGTRGWVSFKSFIPEAGCGFNNNYYTFSNGEIWRHHDETCVTMSYATQEPGYDGQVDPPWKNLLYDGLNQTQGTMPISLSYSMSSGHPENVLRLSSLPKEMFSIIKTTYYSSVIF